MTEVIFVVIVAYDVAIVLVFFWIDCPVHRVKQKMSYQSDLEQQSIT